VPRTTVLKLVAVFEGAKGILVLCAGFGLLLLIHRDLHQAASELISHFHLNPASKYPGIFQDLADRTSDARLWAMAAAAAVYSSVRFAEAIGLWFDRRWAEWFGFLSGAIYLPLEVYELMVGVTWPKVVVFAINSLIVLYLLYILANRRSSRRLNSGG
jgi:uncharacterized membrane protein (DUF2068 family)